MEKNLCALLLPKPLPTLFICKVMDAEAATRAGIEYLPRKVQGRGGVIVIDHHGNCSSGFTTRIIILL
ncbi:MAG: hypothetical protein QNL62_25510 [Gammaproteobacteria bacterium]|nr:hypothetical protein [Gammaproteobacteria bacterium]